MRTYLLIALVTFLFSSCAPNYVITGVADDAKDGACIRTTNGVYSIEKSSSWHDSIKNKKVKAWVKIKRKAVMTKEDLYDSITKTYKQGRVGTTLSVQLKKLEILQEIP